MLHANLDASATFRNAITSDAITSVVISGHVVSSPLVAATGPM